MKLLTTNKEILEHIIKNISCQDISCVGLTKITRKLNDIPCPLSALCEKFEANIMKARILAAKQALDEIKKLEYLEQLL